MATLKYSRQRESIKEFLANRHDHPTADIVYDGIRKKYPNISLGTVYRNLGLLADLGEIRKVTTGDGADRFDGNTSPHSHFICRECGALLDIWLDDSDVIIDAAQKDFDGQIEGHSTLFYGTCSNCIKKS